MGGLKGKVGKDGCVRFSRKDGMGGVVGFEIECGKWLGWGVNGGGEKGMRAVEEGEIEEDNMLVRVRYGGEDLRWGGVV